MHTHLLMDEAVRFVGKSERAVRNAIKSGKVRAVKFSGDRRYLIERASLLGWIQSPTFYRPYKTTRPLLLREPKDASK